MPITVPSALLPGQPAHPPLATPAAPAHDMALPDALAAGLPCWSSQTLLRQGSEACIRHGDATYRLRLTRQGKLILTK